MKRRAFVTGMGAMFAAPLGVETQPAPKIGMLFSVIPAVAAPNLEAFRNGLRALGHVEGKTFVVVPRYGGFLSDFMEPTITKLRHDGKVECVLGQTYRAVDIRGHKRSGRGLLGGGASVWPTGGAYYVDEETFTVNGSIGLEWSWAEFRIGPK
jgi:hypothetical protein